MKWWTGRLDDGMLLPRVALRIAHLKAYAADMERTFSTIKGIQGSSRLSFLQSTLVDIARLKILYNETLNDDELDELDQSTLTSDDQQSQNTSMNSSTSSQNDSSTVTEFQDQPNWLENQEVKIKKCYQAFFQYFDFSITHEGTKQSQQTSTEVSDDQIRDYVKSVCEQRKNKRSRVCYYSQAQIDQYEAFFIKSGCDNVIVGDCGDERV